MVYFITFVTEHYRRHDKSLKNDYFSFAMCGIKGQGSLSYKFSYRDHHGQIEVYGSVNFGFHVTTLLQWLLWPLLTAALICLVKLDWIIFHVSTCNVISGK